MSRMFFTLFVKLDQKRFITYFTNVLFLISFGNILRISGLMLSGKHEDLTLKDVFVGRVAEDYDLLNYFFIISHKISYLDIA